MPASTTDDRLVQVAREVTNECHTALAESAISFRDLGRVEVEPPSRAIDGNSYVVRVKVDEIYAAYYKIEKLGSWVHVELVDLSGFEAKKTLYKNFPL
jgi:hypothetical protein